MRSIIVLLERMCKIYANQLKTIFHFYLQRIIDDPSVVCSSAEQAGHDIARHLIHLHHILIGQDDQPDCPVKQMLL